MQCQGWPRATHGTMWNGILSPSLLVFSTSWCKIHSWICSLLNTIPVCCVTHQETCICNDQWLTARIVSLTEEHQREFFYILKQLSKPKSLLSPAMVSPQVTSSLALNKLLLGCFEVHQTDVILFCFVLMRVLHYSDTHSNVWTLQCQIQPLVTS